MQYPSTRRQFRLRKLPLVVAGQALISLMTVIGAGGCDSIPIADLDGILPDERRPGSRDVEQTAQETLAVSSDEADDLPEALRITAQPVFCCNPLRFDLEAHLSTSSASMKAGYEWHFGDGLTGRGRKVSHTFPWPGTYIVQVTASLPGGEAERAELTLVVGEEIEAPDADAVLGSPDGDRNDPAPASVELTAEAGMDRDVLPGSVVVLDASASRSTGLEPMLFSWRQISGPSVSLASPTQGRTTFVAPNDVDEPMLLVFELTVTQSGVSATDRVSIRVSPDAQPAVIADAGADMEVESGALVLLDGGNSRGSGPEPLQFEWVQLSGTPVELTDPYSVTTTFTAPEAADGSITLTFQLTVAQNGFSDTDSTQVVVVGAGGEPGASKAQILEWLRALPALPKVHYSWPFPGDFVSDPDNDALLREYVRISGAACVWGLYTTPQALDRMMSICREINAEDPSIPASLCVLFRPWEREFPPDAPPTYVGPEHDAEIRLFEDKLSAVVEWVEANNQAHASPVEISAVLLECERFKIKDEDDPDHEAWNQAVDEKHDAIWYASKRILPDVRVEWYSRGASRLFTFREQGDTFSVPLYRVPEPEVERALYNRVYRIALDNGGNEVTPWVALGTAYGFDDDGKELWSFKNDYELRFSYDMGAYLNGLDATQVIVFWPPPFDGRVSRWADHFVSYVRGALGLEPVPE